jgi:hypothetical protein
MGEWNPTNLARKIIAIANATAESIASRSPMLNKENVKDISNAFPLIAAAKNPTIAIIAPMSCTLVSRSFRKNHARNSTTVVSRGPVIVDSFEAPILLTESYQVIIPIAMNADPGRRCFQDLKTVILSFIIRLAINSDIPPASGMLLEDIVRGDI